MKTLSAAYVQSEYATATRTRISQILSEHVSLSISLKQTSHQTLTKFSLCYEVELVWLVFELYKAQYTVLNCTVYLLQSGRSGLSGGNKGSASFIRQCMTLTQRSFVNMTRDPGYYWLRVAMYVMVGLCLGTIFWRVGFHYTSILVSCVLFVVIQSNLSSQL